MQANPDVGIGGEGGDRFLLQPLFSEKRKMCTGPFNKLLMEPDGYSRSE